MKGNNSRKIGFEPVAQLAGTVLGVVAFVLFLLGFSTGYYIFGQMNSVVIVILLTAGIIMEFLGFILRKKGVQSFWVLLFSYFGIAFFTGAAFLLIGDRVEGIGNCIVTDFDAGHGGEEAIYYSLAASGLLLVSVVLNVIGCFSKKSY